MWAVKRAVIALVILPGITRITGGPTPETKRHVYERILWILTQAAIENYSPQDTLIQSPNDINPRQNINQRQNPSYGYYQNPSTNFYQNPHFPSQGYYTGLPRPQYFPNRQHLFQQPNLGQNHVHHPQRQSLGDVLNSIAKNDDLHCVPRLLCEITSGTLSSGSRQSKLAKLPFHVDLETILGMLANFQVDQPTPLFLFGKAAFVGYASKGKSAPCMQAYPTCPREPDKLVEYLNNHNGGFFRFFSGVQPVQQHHLPNRIHQNKLLQMTQIFSKHPEQRIQNINREPNEHNVKFPIHDEDREEINKHQHQLSYFKFPQIINNDKFKFGSYHRKPKEISQLSANNAQNSDSRRHPWTKTMIFPDRTGTGELRLDPDEFTEKPFIFGNNNNLIRLDVEANDDSLKEFNEVGFTEDIFNFERLGEPLFRFPT